MITFSWMWCQCPGNPRQELTPRITFSYIDPYFSFYWSRKGQKSFYIIITSLQPSMRDKMPPQLETFLQSSSPLTTLKQSHKHNWDLSHPTLCQESTQETVIRLSHFSNDGTREVKPRSIAYIHALLCSLKYPTDAKREACLLFHLKQ